MLINFKNWLQALFGGHSLKGLQEKSTLALDVFERVMIDLNKVNAQVLEQKKIKDDLIKEAQIESLSLASLHDKNSRVIEKIQSIIV